MIYRFSDYTKNTINENLNISITPNVSRQSGTKPNLVYLSFSKSYASAYANGETNSAHVYRKPIHNGVLFYICMDDITVHYGGDIWASGYKRDIIDDLTKYKKLFNSSNGQSTHELEELTKMFIYECGIGKSPNVKQVDYILSYIKNDDLSIISPYDWSNIQEEFGGYSEVCVKEVRPNHIIKIDVYQDGDIVKTINGDIDMDECENICYHGSPLVYWENILL